MTGNKSSIESSIRVFPENPKDMSNIGSGGFMKKVDKITKTKLFGKDRKKHIYEYDKINTVDINEDCIEISYRGVSIDYDDIINVEFCPEKTIFSEKESWDKIEARNNYFIRLVTAKYDCPFCSHSDYLSSLKTHIDRRHNSEYDTTKIKDQDRELFYIYLIGEVNLSTLSDTTTKEFKNPPDVSEQDYKNVVDTIKQKCDNLENDLIILNDWIEKTGELRIEGLQKGNSTTRGSITGSISSEGTSKGVQVGPFTKGKSKSQGSIDGKIQSVTSDNTFTSNIEFLQIDQHGIYVKSDPVINISHSDIDRVTKRDNGIFLELGQHTYSISGYKSGGNGSFEAYNIDSIISTIQEQIEVSKNREENTDESNNQSGQTNADKIRELKELHDDGVISKEEFESKKKKLIDDF